MAEKIVSMHHAFDFGFDIGFEGVYCIDKDGKQLAYDEWKKLPFEYLEECVWKIIY